MCCKILLAITSPNLTGTAFPINLPTRSIDIGSLGFTNS